MNSQQATKIQKVTFYSKTNFKDFAPLPFYYISLKKYNAANEQKIWDNAVFQEHKFFYISQKTPSFRNSKSLRKIFLVLSFLSKPNYVSASKTA